jgi:hypothetical protein
MRRRTPPVVEQGSSWAWALEAEAGGRSMAFQDGNQTALDEAKHV